MPMTKSDSFQLGVQGNSSEEYFNSSMIQPHSPEDCGCCIGHIQSQADPQRLNPYADLTQTIKIDGGSTETMHDLYNLNYRNCNIFTNFYRKLRGKRKKKMKDIIEFGELIEKENWGKMLSLLLNRKKLSKVTYAIENTPNCLQKIMNLFPPPEVVTKIVDICPNLVFELDSLERTPLHFAVLRGVCQPIVSLLIQKNPDAVFMKDSRGKTPLILACDIYTRECKNGIRPLIDYGSGGAYTLLYPGPSLKVVKSLLRQNPQTVFDSDDAGLMASDYILRDKSSTYVLPYLSWVMNREKLIVNELQDDSRRSNLEHVEMKEPPINSKDVSKTILVFRQSSEEIRFHEAINTFLGRSVAPSHDDSFTMYTEEETASDNSQSTAFLTKVPVIVDLWEDCSVISKMD